MYNLGGCSCVFVTLNVHVIQLMCAIPATRSAFVSFTSSLTGSTPFVGACPVIKMPVTSLPLTVPSYLKFSSGCVFCFVSFTLIFWSTSLSVFLQFHVAVYLLCSVTIVVFQSLNMCVMYV